MTPEEHARVKQAFAKAIELPESDRETFIRQQGELTDSEVAEVLSLLRFHEEETLIVSRSARPKPDPKSFRITPAAEETDNLLVDRDVWEDNRQVIRRRLAVIAWVMAAIIAYSLLASVFSKHSHPWGIAVKSLALCVGTVCIYVLQTRKNLSIDWLRYIEWIVMSNIGTLAIVIFLSQLLLSSRSEDLVGFALAYYENYFYWALFILVYGVFMPNPWPRAARVVIPMACIPVAVVATAWGIDPNVSVRLSEYDFDDPFAINFIAAGIAIYTAHVIHGSRVSAFQAKRLAQYRLERMIGAGAMGRVFKAEHILLKRPCAIKLIQPDFYQDAHALERFEREVRATARLTHPNTVEIYDFGQTTDKVFFFAMELLPGENLQRVVEMGGPLPVPRAVHFLTQMCGALEEAHSSGLVHRDIKPANVFASERGGVWDFTKLLDFGLVRETKVDASQSITSGLVAGTPSFLAPEQIENSSRVDARSDLYAVGAVGYFLLTGRPPIVAGSPIETMLRQVNEDPKPPSARRKGIPEDVEAIIMRCLRRNADERFGSAAEVKVALENSSAANQWTDQDAAAWWQSQSTSAR